MTAPQNHIPEIASQALAPAITSQTPLRVRYVETDAMGVVHHSHYVNWFEVARIQLLDDIHCPYASINAMGLHCPVLEVNIQYKKPAFFDDRIIIEAAILEPPKARYQVHYKVLRNNDLLATGTISHGFINHLHRPVRPPAIFTDAVERFFGR